MTKAYVSTKTSLMVHTVCFVLIVFFFNLSKLRKKCFIGHRFFGPIRNLFCSVVEKISGRPRISMTTFFSKTMGILFWHNQSADEMLRTLDKKLKLSFWKILRID